MQSLQGVIDRFTFHNEEDGYSIAKLENGITVVGLLPGVNVGETVQLSGEWVSHSQYGRQFKIDNFKTIYPYTITGITKYLGSGLIKGIGPVTAERIVKVFKEKTLDIIEKDIHRLHEVNGVGKKRIEMIAKAWIEQKSVKNVMVFLHSHNVSANYAIKIFKTYKDDSIKILKENPYRLTYDIWGIGFKTADKIGKSLGFEENHPLRIKAGIIYVLNEAANDGHVYLPFANLIQDCKMILNFELKESDSIFANLQSEELIIQEKDRIYLPAYYYAENGIETRITQLLAKQTNFLDHEISPLRLKQNYFSPEQLDAIQKSLKHKILILTGGPGTGKSTTLLGIIDVYKQLKRRILLAAPTGRAAKRMSEIVGLEAKTIHRLLDYKPRDNTFAYHNNRPLPTDLLVIDEVSMIDTILMNNLLKAVGNNTTLILVGDVDQLPSVGAGNVLRDMIKSKKIPVVRLSQIFRQAQKSQIIMNAHRINEGQIPEIKNRKDSDFFFLEEEDSEIIPELILDLCKKRLPNYYGFDPIKDIQVLTPMYKGESGAINLNQLLQGGLNSSERSINRGGKLYKIGDKVMQLRNNYDKDVFNGDIGYIVNLDLEEHVLGIDFGDKLINYEFSELEEITIAYAISVHKSQGSEYPCVILPLTTSHYLMLQRNLLYTAVTRATKLMVIVGTKRALALSVKNDQIKRRYTSLTFE
jgi:exodeoxyribonuclease V alpha subunit